MSDFSNVPPSDWVASNDLAFAIRDRHPVSPGHTLVITKRVAPTWFEATNEEQSAVMSLVHEVKAALDREFSPAGYNVGFNAGEAAGQTVMHLHVHVIPRYAGDMDDPRGGVRHAIPGKGNYLKKAEPLATGGETDPFLRHLAPEFKDAEAIDILAAFVQQSGVTRLLPFLRVALARGAAIRVLTGDYLDITQAEGLALLTDLAHCGLDRGNDAAPSAEPLPTAANQVADGGATYLDTTDTPLPGTLALRVVEVAPLGLASFHPKSWRFEGARGGVAWVGSSNLSATALGAGVEWNLRVDRDRDPAAYQRVREAFDAVWSRARVPDSAWLADYAARAMRERAPMPVGETDGTPREPYEPHEVQQAALAALAAARIAQRARALVVLATGLGKTLLAAFDFLQFCKASGGTPRLLFVAHRRELLRQAVGAFRAVLAEAGRFPRIGLCVDAEDELDAELVFASVAKLAQPRQRERLSAQRFDYVVFDEVHHATAPSWRRVLDSLAPDFLLGLTATPDRADNADVLGLFDDFLAFEAGIPAGIRCGRLTPFHYFGVRDTIDFAHIPWRNRRWNPEALAREAATEARMQTLWRAWQEHPGTRTLVFCCSVVHAGYVRDWLRARGVNAAAVYTGDGSDDRESALSELAAGTLDALCAVDLFNEGVDLPALDRVVMLRPTESNLLFLQQLGRGLRRHVDKPALTVLDFVGNHRVFARRLESLLRAAGGEHAPRLTELLESDEPLALPDGCLVELELEAKNVLRPFIGPPSAVEEVYRELRQRHGERPRMGELQRMGMRPGTLRDRYGSWFEFVQAEGDLTPDEATALPALRDFLRGVETTAMTKSFKMVTLAVLAETGDPLAGLPLEELSMRCRAWMRRRPELWADVILSEQGAIIDEQARQRWVSYWKKNPITKLTNGNKPLCRQVNGKIFPRCVPAAAEIMAAMIWEIVDFRLSQYVERVALPSSAGAFRCKLIQAHGRPIARLPDRNRYLIPEGEIQARLPDGSVWVFKFAKEFINVARPLGESGNRFGELMREWFGPRAGQRGTGFEIEFERQEESAWSVVPALIAQA